MLKGIGVSKGYGIGKAVIINDIKPDCSDVKYTSAKKEKARLQKAVDVYTAETKKIAEGLKARSFEAEAEIMEGHLTMLADPFMLSSMNENIDSGSVAEAAVDTACSNFYNIFAGADDEIIRERAYDVKDIKDSLIRILFEAESVDVASVPKGSILIAKDFSPSLTSRINKENVVAIISETGSATSHSAILARTMEISAVFSVKNSTDIISNGEALIADGFKGEVIINPSKEKVSDFENKQKAYLEKRAAVKLYFNKPTITKSGNVKKVLGNIGKAEEVQSVIQNGGEGIGLFRTEFLFMNREGEPTEEEQFEAYSKVAKEMNGKEVIIRTLDISGDKAIDYIKTDKELYKKQIRAMLRAAYFGNIKIMLPLVTSVDEVRNAKALIDECAKELEAEGEEYKKAPLGIMIETPSAAIISDLLAKEAEFFSIGTNDLTSFTMAVDRGNADSFRFCNMLPKAVLRLIEMTIKNAKAAGITVGMCGEAAADEQLIPKLVEWGLDEFSVNPASILQTRYAICECE